MRRNVGIIILVVAIVLSSAFTLNNDKYFEIAKNLEIFTSIYKELNTHYVDELDPNTVMRTGIDAIMNSLDPYTVYYSESQVESYRISDDGKYIGLGAASQDIEGDFVITEIYKDGPAQKAGIHVGDILLMVNGESTKGRSYKDILQFIRGFPGTAIELGLYTPSSKQEKNVSLIRSEVETPNVPYSGIVSDGVGYIVLTTFTRDAGRNIASALRKLKEENELKGLILDLRFNGGGLLAEAIDILGIFLPKGSPVVSTKGKVRDRDISYDTRRTPVDVSLPIVVMTNKRSASASEIVAGSLQDYDRGVVMGQRTFGKGLVQNTKEVGYNSRIKLTTSKYYIPSGRCIQAVEYANGAPVDIPDDKREVFKTKAGRPVLDGGGVTPDVKLDVKERPEILESLVKDHWIFNYVNVYTAQLKEVPSMENFSFNEFSLFDTWLQDNHFSFETRAQQSLSKLKKEADKSYMDELGSIEKKMLALKLDDLSEFQKEISKEIEIEIIKRYHFQEGKSRQSLKNDPEVEKAILLLNDQDRYHNILSVQ